MTVRVDAPRRRLMGLPRQLVGAALHSGWTRQVLIPFSSPFRD
jgi:hypothetical protein